MEKIERLLRNSNKTRKIQSRLGDIKILSFWSGQNHNDVEELALEAARVFGVSYFARRICKDGNSYSVAYLEKPVMTRDCVTGFSCDECGFLIAASDEFSGPTKMRPLSQLRDENKDFKIKETLSDNCERYVWNDVRYLFEITKI